MEQKVASLIFICVIITYVDLVQEKYTFLTDIQK